MNVSWKASRCAAVTPSTGFPSGTSLLLPGLPWLLLSCRFLMPCEKSPFPIVAAADSDMRLSDGIFQPLNRCGDYHHFELPGHRDHRPNQGLIVGVFGKTVHILPVKFHRIEKELAKAGKAGCTCAKFIQRKGDSHGLQPVHEGNHQFGHVHGRIFGDFKHQPFAQSRVFGKMSFQRLHPGRVPD